MRVRINPEPLIEGLKRDQRYVVTAEAERQIRERCSLGVEVPEHVARKLSYEVLTNVSVFLRRPYLLSKRGRVVEVRLDDIRWPLVDRKAPPGQCGAHEVTEDGDRELREWGETVCAKCGVELWLKAEMPGVLTEIPCRGCGGTMKLIEADSTREVWWMDYFGCTSCYETQAPDGGPSVGGSEL